MNTIVVGVADCALSRDLESTLVTYALGSCIGLAIYDPVARVGGLLHFMLPEAKLDLDKAALCPYMFADTGIPLLFRRAYELGAARPRLIVRAAGAAQVLNDGGVFNIGKRNYQAMRRILWQAGVMIHGEAMGGSSSRTARLEVGSGRFLVRTPGGPETELHALPKKGVLEWRTAS